MTKKEKDREYYLKHKEAIKEKTKQYRKTHTTEISEYQKQYRLANRDRLYSYKQNYNDLHKEERNSKQKKYYLNHKNEIAHYTKQYQLKHSERLREIAREYRKTHRQEYNERSRQRLLNNINHRITHLLRTRLNKAVSRKSKKASVTNLLGCSIDALRVHLESQFKQGMSWDNRGMGNKGWHIDHIIPCNNFDLTNYEEQRVCFHWSNLQPMWGLDNIKKGVKIAA